MMKVTVAKTAGFCFGVKRAVETVYEQLNMHPEVPIYTWGPIIHNEEVLADLEKKGVKTIDTLDEIGTLPKGIIIVRAHGVSRDVFEHLEQTGMSLIDATCPFVKKIHRIVEKKSGEDNQIIVVGSGDHPEVQGIVGWSKTPAKVIETLEKGRVDIENVGSLIATALTFVKNSELVVNDVQLDMDFVPEKKK